MDGWRDPFEELKLRFRIGQVTQVQIRLAASLGYEPAQRMFPQPEVEWVDWRKRQAFFFDIAPNLVTAFGIHCAKVAAQIADNHKHDLPSAMESLERIERDPSTVGSVVAEWSNIGLRDFYPCCKYPVATIKNAHYTTLFMQQHFHFLQKGEASDGYKERSVSCLTSVTSLLDIVAKNEKGKYIAGFDWQRAALSRLILNS